MKTRNILILMFCMLMMSNLTAKDNELTLKQRIDSLEIKLQEMYKHQMKNSPYTNGKAADWGKGVYFGTKMGTEYSFNLEMGYMWKCGSSPFSAFSRDYIGKEKSYRFGLGLGVQMFDDEPVHKNNAVFYQSSGYGPYMKLLFASPVLFNFISFSGHLKGMYTIPEENSRHNISRERWIFGFGNDLEFWLTEDECITIGYTDEGDTAIWDKKKDTIYPEKIRFVFGFKTHF